MIHIIPLDKKTAEQQTVVGEVVVMTNNHFNWASLRGKITTTEDGPVYEGYPVVITDLPLLLHKGIGAVIQQ